MATGVCGSAAAQYRDQWRTASWQISTRTPCRLQRLLESGIALSSELSLEALLRKVIETAVELTGARYGALGVIDQTGTGLEQFITVGIEPELQARDR